MEITLDLIVFTVLAVFTLASAVLAVTCLLYTSDAADEL